MLQLVRSLAQANALLQAQRLEMSGDAHIRREVDPWMALDPTERLAAFVCLCRDAEAWLARLAPTELERALAPEPIPEDAAAILRALRGGTQAAGSGTNGR